MLFINRWFLSLIVALVVLDSGAQAYRYYRRFGNRFQPVMMKPMPVGRFGFVRAENPNADETMDAKSGEESSEPAPQPAAPQAPVADEMPMQEMHTPQMREMIHDSPHPVEIDMGPGMQARVMGFEGELDEGNFGRAAGEDGEENEQEEGGQFRHFKHKHKKHKYVIHTHHHYHHKKGGHEGYGHHGYGHGKHGGYGHHGGHGGGHGYGHGDEGEGDDYEPTYGHHGRYRRSSMSESAPADEPAPDTDQALDRTALPTHSSPDHPIPLVAGPTMVEAGAPGTAYRQSVSRRQLVRSKNERLAKIGRDRAQRANRYADSQEHDSDGPCPAEYVEAVGEVVGSAQDREAPMVASNKRGPFQTLLSRMFQRPKKQEQVVTADVRKPADPKTVALRGEIQKSIAEQSSKSGPKIGAEMKQYLRTKEQTIVGGPQATNVPEPSVGNPTTACVAPLPGTFLPELGTIVSVRFVDEAGRERTVPFELTARQLSVNGTTRNPAIPLNYNFFYFHCLTPGGAPATNGDRLRSMAKRMIEGLEGGRTGRATGEGESGVADEGSGPQRWLHRRRTKSEWRRRDANAGRRRRPMPEEKVIERRTPEELPLEVPSTVITPVEPVEVEETVEKEMDEETEEEPECNDQICSNFYVDERKITTTSTTPREPEHRLEEELEPKLVPFGNEIDQEVSKEGTLPGTFVAQPHEEPKSTRNSPWRGLSKRLTAFRERQADRGARRKMINLTEQPSTTTADPLVDDDEYDSNEIVEYYQQQDVGRVLYRMANGRLLEEPQRFHLRRSAEADDGSDSNTLRNRRLNRLSNRMNRRRKPAKGNAAPDPQPSEGTIDKSRTPMINIGTFSLTDPKYEGAASAPAPAAARGLENTGAARSVSGTVPADMDNYIKQKVLEYCSTSCVAGKSHPPPVIIMPPAVAPAAVPSNEQIVGSSRQLIVQPPSTYEAATVAPVTARTSAPNSPACPTKIVKCIPKAMAGKSSSSSSSSKRSRKPESTGKSSSSNDPAEEKESNPLVSLARGIRNLIFDRNNPRMMEPFGGMKPTSNSVDRRRQRQDLRRRQHNRPQTRPLDAFKNAIDSIRHRVMPTTTTPVPTTVARRRLGAGRSRKTKSDRSSPGMVSASLTPAAVPPPPPAPPAPINCAECRRLCTARGRARARPLNAARRPGSDPMVASGTPAEDGIVASPAGAAGAPFGNVWNNLVDMFNPGDGMVASAGPGDEGSNFMQKFADFFAFPEDGMVSSTKDGDGQGLNFWNLFAVPPAEKETMVSAARLYADDNLPYCEDIIG